MTTLSCRLPFVASLVLFNSSEVRNLVAAVSVCAHLMTTMAKILTNSMGSVRVQPLISYFSYMHYHIIVLHSCVVLTVFDLLERCVSLVLRLAI